MQSYQVLHATLIIHVNNLLFFKVDMVLSCIVFGCNNNSTDPRCCYLQWHRLPSNQEALEQLRRVLKIPNDILVHSKKIKYLRICSHCMSQIPKSRKPPVIRKNNVTTVKHSYTRSELRRAIALDHSYSQPPDQDSINNSSCLTSIDQNESIILKPEVPILQQMFCIETYTNNDDAITFYTSFQTYSHFMIIMFQLSR